MSAGSGVFALRDFSFPPVLQTGLLVYFDNYGRYDWTRYFFGYTGLDVRWTAARHAMWGRRLDKMGGVRAHVEVWHEDQSGVGDEEWETTVSPSRGRRGGRERLGEGAAGGE